MPLSLKKVEGDSRYSGHFQVNRTTAHLLIDSGANSTDIDASFGKIAGIKPDRRTKVVSRGALGRPITSHLGYGSLRAGPLTITPFAFSLAPDVHKNTATSRYNGQIGLDGLNALSAILDFNSGQLWVPNYNAQNRHRGSLVPLGLVHDMAFDAVPLKEGQKLPHLIYHGHYKRKPIRWIIDTGAEVTILSQATARRLAIPTKSSSAHIVDASGDEAPVRTGLLTNIRFGTITVRQFEVAIADLSVVRENFRDLKGQPIDGIIGMDFLEQSHAILDTKSKILYLGPSR